MHSPLRVKIQNALNKALQLEHTDVLFVGGRRRNRKRRKHGESLTSLFDVLLSTNATLFTRKMNAVHSFILYAGYGISTPHPAEHFPFIKKNSLVSI